MTLILVLSLFAFLGCGVFNSVIEPLVSKTPAATPTKTAYPDPTLAPIPTSSLSGVKLVPVTPVCRTSVDGINTIRKDLKIPDHFIRSPLRQDSDFDVNQYFSVLTHLSMAPGYTLDYFIDSNGLGGRPAIYARKSTDAPFKNDADYSKSIDAQKASLGAYTPLNHDSDYLAQVHIDGSHEGYFQYAAMALLAGQFYLEWHANYNDTRIICDTSDLKLIDNELGFLNMKLPRNVAEASKKLDYTPGVSIDDQSVTVRFITFSKWGGFTENIFVLDKQSPFKAHDIRHIELVKYQVGIAF